MGLKLAPNLCEYVPVPVASHFFIGRCQRPFNSKISAHLPTPYMYFNSFANYFGINGLQTGTKCILVCAGPIAGLLAGAGGQ